MLSISRSTLRSLVSSRTSFSTSKSIPSLRFFSTITLSSSASLRPNTSYKSFLSNASIQSSNYASTTGPSSTFDPREAACQELIDSGNKALADQDLQSAGRAYEESLRIKDSAIGKLELSIAEECEWLFELMLFFFFLFPLSLLFTGNYNLGVVRYTEKNLPVSYDLFGIAAPLPCKLLLINKNTP